MREKYQPLFDKYGVDIVLQGHNHIIFVYSFPKFMVPLSNGAKARYS